MEKEKAQRFGVYYTPEMMEQEQQIREHLEGEGIDLNRSELVRYLLNKYSREINKKSKTRA